MPSFIFVEYVWRILGRGAKKPPSIREQPWKSPSWIGLKPERDIFTTLLSIYGKNFLRKWLKKAKIAKSQFQYFFIIFGFPRPFSTNVQCIAFNMGHCFEPSRSLMSWDGKKQKKSSSFNTTDGKSRTKFLRIYVKSHNTCIVTGHKNLVCSYDLKGLLNILNIFLVICKL